MARLLSAIFATALLAALAQPAAAATLMVGNKIEGTVSFIDLETGEEVARRETAPSPHEVTLSPDGATLVVVSYMEDGYVGHELDVLDVATATRLERIDIAPHQAPHGIMWVGGSSDVVVVNELSRDVAKVDIAAGEVVASAATDQAGSHLLALLPDASRAFVTNRDADTVSVIDVEDMVVAATLDAEPGPEGIGRSPDGSEVWVASKAAQTIVIYDTGSLAPIDTIELDYLPIRVRLSPSGTIAAVADLNGNRTVIYDRESREELAVVDLAEAGAIAPASLLFADDGAFLYTSAQESANVVEIETTGFTITRVFEAGAGADGMAISPLATSPD